MTEPTTIAGTPQARIMIVEDERIVAMDVQSRLAALGYRVLGPVANGVDAIRLAGEGKPNLVLMDIMLDGAMTGIEAAAAIHSQHRIPVVYMTAYSDAETLARAKLTEPFGYIHKPLDQRELHATIEMALYKHSIESRSLESERKYRSMMEAMSDMVYICSPAYRIEYMNPAMIRRVGRDATGEPCHQALHELHERCPWCVNERVFKGEQVQWEMTTPRDRRTFRIANTPIGHADGSTSMMAIITDITERKRAEQALQEGETRYRRLVESVTDYIYTVKVESGKAVSTVHGPACQAVTGYTSADYEADPDLWLKMVHVDDRKVVLDQAQRVLTGQPCQPLEHRIIHKDGRVFWVRNTSVPHFDSAGRLVAYDGLVANISDRKIAEEKIKEHARRLEIVNRVIVAVNKAVDLPSLCEETLDASLRLLQFEGGAVFLLDETATTASVGFSRGLRADFVDQYRNLAVAAPPFRRVCLDGLPTFMDDLSRTRPDYVRQWKVAAVAEIPLIAKDQVVGALVVTRAVPHLFAHDEKESLLSIGRQLGTVIVKMRSELALRESEAKYRIITEQSLVGIQMIKDGRLIFVNDGWCKIVGYTREDVQQWTAEDLRQIIHPNDQMFFMEQLRRKQAGIKEGVVPVYDCRFISKPGQTCWVLLHSRVVEFADGRAVLGMLIDITDRKLAEQALATANRQLKAREEQLRAANEELFAANEQLTTNERELMAANREKEVLLKEIHHRVKNNLQVVSSLLKLQMGHMQDEKAISVIRDCQNRIKSIAIVHEKLYQSKNLADIDIGEYIRSLTNHLFRMYLVNSDTIRLDVVADQVSIDVDQAIPCSLIVNELVSNSLKYAFPSERKGHIRVEMRALDEQQCLLEVADDGLGLPPDTDFANTATLGLQLVMTFVEQLGGVIALDRTGGTTFRIRFPRTSKAAAATPAPTAPGPVRPTR